MRVKSLQKKILVVDSDTTTLDQARSALEDAGYLVMTHERLTGCLTRVILEQPDLVLLDGSMTDRGGETIVNVLRSAGARGRIIVLLHASVYRPDLKPLAKRIGAD